MHTVYVLQDENGKLYKGLTNDLSRRVGEHQSGQTKTTRSMKNARVVYTEEYTTLAEARAREVYLKSAEGRTFLKKKIGPLA